MSSYLDKYRTGRVSWLVYYYRGEIKVSRGYVANNGTFTLADRNSWQTQVPASYMKVSSAGKVLVRNEEDIPRAKMMIYEHYLGKIKDIEEKALSALYGIQKMVKEQPI